MSANHNPDEPSKPDAKHGINRSRLVYPLVEAPATEVPKWQTNRIPELILSNGCFDRLATEPDEVKVYRYLFKEGENWSFLLAIDEQSKTIFYFRSSW